MQYQLWVQGLTIVEIELNLKNGAKFIQWRYH